MSSNLATNTASSYINIGKLTSSDFDACTYANNLVLSTNNPSDALVDLTTPLSRTLFDLQEIDTNIHTLTSRSALDILNYTSLQNVTAGQILARVEEERTRLNTSYERLEAEVLGQYSKASNAKLNAERSHRVLNLGRSVQRALNLARYFEVYLTDSGLATSHLAVAGKASSKEDHRLLLQASYTILSFRDLLSRRDASELVRVNIVRTVRGRVFEDGEARVLDFARRIVREFTVSPLIGASGSSFSELEESRLRFTSAVHILYLLSPAPKIDGGKMAQIDFEPEYMLRALQAYLQSALQSSVAGIGRGLAQLPTLDKALVEASARCQNVVALEALLQNIALPEHPLLTSKSLETAQTKDNIDDLKVESDEEDTGSTAHGNLLDLLLDSLDTSSLPSYFWRSLSVSLGARVQDILNKGGVSARTLRANKDSIREEIRECVLRGSRMPGPIVSVTAGKRGKEQVLGNWEREAAVMVGSIMGPLSR